MAINKLIQQSLGLNPDWLLLKRSFLLINSQILSKINFSKILEQMGKRETRRLLFNICLEFFCAMERCYIFFSHLEKLLAEGNFYISLTNYCEVT